MSEVRETARQPQTAYDAVRGIEGSESLEERLYQSMYIYLREDLGLPELVAQARAQAEVSGQLVRNVCDECERAGLTFREKRVLDLGAGLGGISAEAARRGSFVIGVEPGAGWRQLASERIAQAGEGIAVGAIGEELPLATNSIDLILSLQVLEHVRSPERVIREAFRVLKPGGYFFFSYENYLSFWEPHYRVRWFPLLPKRAGAAYLRWLGRDPRFLTEAVTYTTFVSVRRLLRRTGFECEKVTAYKLALKSPGKTGLKWKMLKTLAYVNESAAVRLFTAIVYARHTFRTAIWEFVRKPC